MTKSTSENKKENYQKTVERFEPKPPLFRNALNAFIFGGIVSIVGQLLTDFYKMAMNLSVKEAGNPAVATMILIGSLLTGLGYFDKLVKYAGSGLTVPVTGFANSVTSSALEFKKEGLVMGVGSKMFMLAGSVITFGVITAFIVGLIYAILFN